MNLSRSPMASGESLGLLFFLVCPMRLISLRLEPNPRLNCIGFGWNGFSRNIREVFRHFLSSCLVHGSIIGFALILLGGNTK